MGRGRVFVATSDDPAVLQSVFLNSCNSPEHRASAWYRFEAIKWYHAYRERGLVISGLEPKQARAVREYIMEINMRTKK